MPGSSIVGSGSDMPISMYLQKMEQTCLFEDPEILDMHNRSTLKNMRPDAPFFESDQPRRNTYAQDRLNLREGGRRTLTDPFLPDGTFLDHQFLEKDPRGSALGPDMMQYRKQQESRTQFIKQYPDNDDSVPESGWHPTKVIRDIAGQFYNVKDRMKIFSESEGSFHAGGTKSMKLTSTGACLQKTDERAPEMQDEMCANRTNYVHDLSNNTPMGWRLTTDHVFKIAKYGQQRANAPLSTQRWNKNRANARVEHDIFVSWQDQNIPKSLSLKMIDIARQKMLGMDSATGNINYEESNNARNRALKLTPVDLSGLQNHYSEDTQPDAPHTNLNGIITHHRSGLTGMQRFDADRMEKSIIDPFLFEFMTLVNRKMGAKEMADLRDEIIQSDEYQSMILEQKNRAINGKLDLNNELLWKSEAQYVPGQSMKVANYVKLSRNNYSAAKNQNDVDMEQYTKNSKEQHARNKNLRNASQYGFDVVDFDGKTDNITEITGTKLIGGLGKKYMRPYMDCEDFTPNELQDLTAQNAY